MIRAALTIAASDPSGGAGIQADLAVFRDLGVYGFSVITNVTSQNSQGVHKVCKTPPNIIAAQIDDVTRDFSVSACKIGMLYSPQAVDVVAERIDRRNIPNVVLDPVMNAKHGEVLLTPPAVKRLKRNLIKKATIITPNAGEAQVLTGIEVKNLESAKDAARALIGMGAKYALIKGGHIDGEPIDILFDGQTFTEFQGKRLEKNMHGTGCVLSSAIGARLALGDTIEDAIAFSKNYISQAIQNSVKLGKGQLDYYRGIGK